MSLVSVLIPTFNREETILRAVNSVLNQKYKNLECIVIDDASTDLTSDVLGEIKDPRLKVIHQSQNRGVSTSRNAGFAQAQGDYIALLDSDDEWLPHRLQDQIPLMKEYSLVHGEEIWIRRGKRVNPKKIHQKSGGRIFKRCLHLCLISPSATLMSRKLYTEMNGFREDFPVCEDYELWLRVTERYNVGFVSHPIINKYGGHDDQLSQKYKAMDYWRVKAMQELKHSVSLSEDDLAELKRVMKKKCEILLNGYTKHQNYTSDYRYIKDCLESL